MMQLQEKNWLLKHWKKTMFFVFIIIFFIGEWVFFTHIPKNKNGCNSTDYKADGIIVLTGQRVGRISHGVNLLNMGHAPKMLISGVSNKVKEPELKCVFHQQLLSKITLGYKAHNTMTNALEAKAWAQQNNMQTIILVTSAVHMPRSLYAFHKIMPPKCKIVPSAVFNSPPNIINVTREYIKTILTVILIYFNCYNVFLDNN